MKNQIEIWKPVAQSLYYCGVGDIYEASNLGRIRNKKTGHILKSSSCNGNPNRRKVIFHYSFTSLSFLKSHVIWETFVGPCYNKRIYFKDGNPDNCELSNLYMKSK